MGNEMDLFHYPLSIIMIMLYQKARNCSFAVSSLELEVKFYLSISSIRYVGHIGSNLPTFPCHVVYRFRSRTYAIAMALSSLERWDMSVHDLDRNRLSESLRQFHRLAW